MVQARPNVDRRRQEFINYLRTLGTGSECVYIPWMTPYIGPRGRLGYQSIMIGRQKMTASRWVYAEIIGPVSPEVEICHTCDNPPCVRPSHLWAGTGSQNIRDSIAKGRFPGGRGPVGERHGMAKVSDEDVLKMRAMLAQGVSQRIVGNAFGLTQAHVSKIARGVSRRLPYVQPAHRNPDPVTSR